MHLSFYHAILLFTCFPISVLPQLSDPSCSQLHCHGYWMVNLSWLGCINHVFLLSWFFSALGRISFLSNRIYGFRTFWTARNIRIFHRINKISHTSCTNVNKFNLLAICMSPVLFLVGNFSFYLLLLHIVMRGNEFYKTVWSIKLSGLFSVYVFIWGFFIWTPSSVDTRQSTIVI